MSPQLTRGGREVAKKGGGAEQWPGLEWGGGWVGVAGVQRSRSVALIVVVPVALQVSGKSLSATLTGSGMLRALPVWDTM